VTDVIARKIRRAETDSICPVAYPASEPVVPTTEGDTPLNADDNSNPFAPALQRRNSQTAAGASPSTDASAGPERAGVANLLRIYSAVTGFDLRSRDCEFPDQRAMKQALTERLIEHMKPIREELIRLRAAPEYVERVLRDGRDEAEAIAERTLKDVKQTIGLRLPPNPRS
jgi:hypothetical protein